jgi:hypothetical protein
MAQAATTEASIRSAMDSVRQARETLQRLKSRLQPESVGVLDGYIEALETATGLTDQLMELLASKSEDRGAARDIAADSD